MAQVEVKSTMRSDSIGTLEFKDINGSGFPTGYFMKPSKFFVKIAIGDDQVKQTKSQGKGKDPKWTDTLTFGVEKASKVKIEVYARRVLHRDDFVGGLDIEVEKLLGTQSARLPLLPHNAEGRSAEFAPTLQITVIAIGAGEAIASAKAAMAGMKGVGSGLGALDKVVKQSELTAKVITPVADPWVSLLDNVKIFTEMVDKVTEIHPYAKAAWNILSAAHKALLAQKDRDERVTKLLQSLDDTYAFVKEAEPIKVLESQKEILKLIVLQTTECAYFIRDYTKAKHFAARTVTSYLTHADKIISQYQTKLDELKAALRHRAILYTEITVLRNMEKVEEIVAEMHLNELPRALGAGFDPDKACFLGTRLRVLDQITEWVNSVDEEVPRVLLLVGVAGSGKSAVVHSVAQRFHELKRLGSSYCFDRARLVERNPSNLFSSIAHDLAFFDPQRKKSLSALLEVNPTFRTTKSVTLQFQELILKPSAGMQTIGPTLIAIDALDECGDYSNRKTLIDVLATKLKDLPPNFRVLITSRPEPDVMRDLDNKSHIRISKLTDMAGETTHGDIESFIGSELRTISFRTDQYPQQHMVKQLAERSEDLFQWAATVCRFIEGDGRASVTASERLHSILSPDDSRKKGDVLDKLYLGILRETVDTTDASLSRFKCIIGVYSPRDPLGKKTPPSRIGLCPVQVLEMLLI